jgi:hypothetical protein
MRQTGLAHEMPMYFDMPSNCTIADAGVRPVVITASGNEKYANVYKVNKRADSTKEPS